MLNATLVEKGKEFFRDSWFPLLNERYKLSFQLLFTAIGLPTDPKKLEMVKNFVCNQDGKK